MALCAVQQEKQWPCQNVWHHIRRNRIKGIPEQFHCLKNSLIFTGNVQHPATGDHIDGQMVIPFPKGIQTFHHSSTVGFPFCIGPHPCPPPRPPPPAAPPAGCHPPWLPLPVHTWTQLPQPPCPLREGVVPPRLQQPPPIHLPAGRGVTWNLQFPTNSAVFRNFHFHLHKLKMEGAMHFRHSLDGKLRIFFQIFQLLTGYLTSSFFVNFCRFPCHNVHIIQQKLLFRDFWTFG